MEKKTDILNKLDEAIGSESVLKNLRWEQVMYKFFETFQMLKSMSINKKNKKALIAFKTAESMLKDLQTFVDSFTSLEKLERIARDEMNKLNTIR